MSMPLATTTHLICTLSMVHVSAKHIFSWMPQLLYDFPKEELICMSGMNECMHATIQIRYI